MKSFCTQLLSGPTAGIHITTGFGDKNHAKRHETRRAIKTPSKHGDQKHVAFHASDFLKML